MPRQLLGKSTHHRIITPVARGHARESSFRARNLQLLFEAVVFGHQAVQFRFKGGDLGVVSFDEGSVFGFDGLEFILEGGVLLV